MEGVSLYSDEFGRDSHSKSIKHFTYVYRKAVYVRSSPWSPQMRLLVIEPRQLNQFCTRRKPFGYSPVILGKVRMSVFNMLVNEVRKHIYKILAPPKNFAQRQKGIKDSLYTCSDNLEMKRCLAFLAPIHVKFKLVNLKFSNSCTIFKQPYLQGIVAAVKTRYPIKGTVLPDIKVYFRLYKPLMVSNFLTS